MNELKTFTFGTHAVRTVEHQGDLWWVLKDVCEVLEISNARDVFNRLEEDEKGVGQIDTLGGSQKMNIINESGLYSVILRSDKPQAKPFRKWVTSEVLPSIRKTGGYIAGQNELSPEELMARALMVAQQTLADREARISALTVQTQIMQPKADYFDQLVDRNLLTSFRDTAKQLGVKEREFIRFLMDQKYLYRNKKGKLTPYADKNVGLFEVKECFNDKTEWSGTQTLVTPKGRETFRLLLQGL